MDGEVNAAWLSFPIIMCESYLASGDKPVKQNANAESQHTKQMNREQVVLELVKLLSQAIDIIRNDGSEDDADYLDNQLQQILDSLR